MNGENFVSLKGTIQWPELKRVGQNNTPLFKGKLVIPIEDKAQYLKIAAWNQIAEGLHSIPEGRWVHIHGHVEERSYDGKCKHCQNAEKKYWTEVVVDQFQILQ
jgi:single-stranded DNA-binding protein